MPSAPSSAAPLTSSTPFGPAPTRRTLLAAGGALGLGALLTACGDDKPAATDPDYPGWSFQDDRGTTARTKDTPRRIVAYIGAAAALHDLGVECTGVFGPTKLKNGEPDVQAADIDVDKVTVLGNEWGRFNVEKYAALKPDLLVTTMNVSPTLWYVPEESAEKIAAVAPTVGILTGRTSLTQAIGRFSELAGALGADLEAAEVKAAKKRFEEASEKLRRAARARRGLKVMAVSATPDLLYVGNPADFTDLRHYRELGVEFVTPDSTGKDGFFQEVGWENADKYRADLILVDRRTGNLQPADLKRTKPTWAKLPAVRAGQVTSWSNEAQFSHAGYAPLVERLADSLDTAKSLA
ncbi:ABC transporter substrate-binding protein [Streptomyces longispororuber]|uniref:ABC transporter substrate-binding protein n=1 Tax=Streptomyces longispororuber TaxID=68230 RepID=UPI002109D3C4|nr:ABC transporter substrate-binding protein [Streptomyces longispororuber]MCQ4213428.1 ABC transporter substrate-binding protein [Streptomyces longispororuber]